MPITLDKHLALLAAAEDALQALAKLEALIGSQLAVARASGNWKDPFEELEMMGKAEFLLDRPLATNLNVKIEREFYSNTRLGINRRAKEAQAKKRATRQGPEKEASSEQNPVD